MHTFARITHAKRKDANLNVNNALDTVKLIPAQKTIATGSVRTTLHSVTSMLVSIVDAEKTLGLAKDYTSAQITNAPMRYASP